MIGPRELGRRVAAAWRVLRHGPPSSAPPERVRMARADLLATIDRTFELTGLPVSWRLAVPTLELEAACTAIELLCDARQQDWARVEQGSWPC